MADAGRTDQTDVTVEVADSAAGERLDKYLGSLSDLKLSRTRVQKLLAAEKILVNGSPAVSKYRVKGGETVTIVIPPKPPDRIIGENIPLDIVFEDEHLLVVNKPSGMVTHPAVGNQSGTLVNALVYYLGGLPECGDADRPGIVHRLDRETSGLLIIARSDEAHGLLQKAIQAREVKRQYLAVVCGHLKDEQGRIEHPIGRSLKNRTRMAVTTMNSRDAITDYAVTDRYRSYDRVEVSLQTGRTHQIRVHFSHLGHPVFGDPEYGGREKWHKGMFGPERPLANRLLDRFPRQALHAQRLVFSHPINGESLEFMTDPPSDMQELLAILDTDGR